MNNVKFKRTSSSLTRERIESIADSLTDWFEEGPKAGDPITIISIKGNYLNSKDNDSTMIIEFLTDNEHKGTEFVKSKVKL